MVKQGVFYLLCFVLILLCKIQDVTGLYFIVFHIILFRIMHRWFIIYNLSLYFVSLWLLLCDTARYQL